MPAESRAGDGLLYQPYQSRRKQPGCPGYSPKAGKQQNREMRLEAADGDGYESLTACDGFVVGSLGHQRALRLSRCLHYLCGITAARQILCSSLSAATTARCNTQLPLQVGQCLGALGYGRFDLTLGNGITDTNEHENNYCLNTQNMQLILCITSKRRHLPTHTCRCSACSRRPGLAALCCLDSFHFPVLGNGTPSNAYALGLEQLGKTAV